MNYMSDSSLNVISFDAFKEEYLSMQGLEKSMANSADALTSSAENTYLIEFKNGETIDNHQVENKLKDSVTILCDVWNKTISDTRKEIIFVLVYNEDAKNIPITERRAISMANKSGQPHARFGLNKANLYVKKALIYNKNELKKSYYHSLKRFDVPWHG